MTSRNSSSKESVIRVLKANPSKPMSNREIHDYMLAKDYKMCGLPSVANAVNALRKDGFLEVVNADGAPHVKSTSHSGRRQMYAIWHKEQETVEETSAPASVTGKHVPPATKVPMHKSLAVAQEDDGIEEMLENSPAHVSTSIAWLALKGYDILIVKK